MSRLDPIVSALSRTFHLGGEVWECGSNDGTFAEAMLPHVAGRTFRLFDTFEGMPFSGPHDHHQVGCMKADYEKTRARFSLYSHVILHKGIMPDSFAGLEDSRIAVANIDVDNYDSVLACLSFVYPRVPAGGYIFLDDYACGNCPGAKRATHEFLLGKPEVLTLNPERGAAQAYFAKL